jgi:hypothetical protein
MLGEEEEDDAAISAGTAKAKPTTREEPWMSKAKDQSSHLYLEHDTPEYRS